MIASDDISAVGVDARFRKANVCLSKTLVLEGFVALLLKPAFDIVS